MKLDRHQLLDQLRSEGVSDSAVLNALDRVPREEFVLPEDRERAYANRALGIESGQTISQPLIVGLMTQLLELRGSERVLEVGTGSGYQAAVLSVLAREVYSIELDRLLGRTAENRLASLGYANVHVRVGDGFYGWPEMAPFDRIIITAVAPRIPETLVAQLKIGGTLVMPIEQEERQVLVRARKTGDAALSVEEHGSVAFVPMLGAVRK